MQIRNDIHTHIGKFYDCNYQYSLVFNALKKCGIEETSFAYLTPLFTDFDMAFEFYKSMTDEVIKAISYAEKVGLKVTPLYWVDPLILSGNIKLEKIFKDANYKGLVIHPFLNDWNIKNDRAKLLLKEVFDFAENNKYEIYIHTGCSEKDNPQNFEEYFKNYKSVKVHLAHCKDPKPIIDLFRKYTNLVGDTAFCPLDSYSEICDAGFKDRMLFGTDFPVTHWWHNYKDAEKSISEEILISDYEISVNENAIIKYIELNNNAKSTKRKFCSAEKL